MLNAAQLATLKASIAADGSISGLPHTPDNAAIIAGLYNLAASPDFWVWRTFVPDTEIYSVTSPDATTWSWSVYIARSQGERDAWRQMTNMAGGINMSLANVRSGIADIFSGAGGANQRNFLASLGRRKATRLEKLLKSSGAGTTVDPAVMGFEGSIDSDDVQSAWDA